MTYGKGGATNESMRRLAVIKGQSRAALLRLGLAVAEFSLDGAWMEAVVAGPAQPV